MLWMDLGGASSSIIWLPIRKRIFCGSSSDPLVRSSPWRWLGISRPTNAKASASSPWQITTRPWWPYRVWMDTPWATEFSKYHSRPTNARHKSSNPSVLSPAVIVFFPHWLLTGVATNLFLNFDFLAFMCTIQRSYCTRLRDYNCFYSGFYFLLWRRLRLWGGKSISAEKNELVLSRTASLTSKARHNGGSFGGKKIIKYMHTEVSAMHLF